MEGISLRHITLGTCLKFLGTGILIVSIGWYVHFQARSFLKGPMVTLEGMESALHSEKTIPLVGTAKNIVKLTLNGKEIHTNEKGDFTHTLILEDGYTIMTLFAQDRFGRTTSLTREYVYVPEEA